MKQTPYTDLERLQREFEHRKGAIQQRIADFAAVQPGEYFHELAYCLLTPQSSAVNAAKAVERLKAAGFFQGEIEPAEILNRKDAYIRFHNTKATHLKEAKQRIHEILTVLGNGQTGEQLRTWLVKNVKGLGWKEASHFLRNIGHRDLAILDRHILRNLKQHHVLRALPRTLTPKRYLAIERRFKHFSGAIGIPMDELDLLFWSRETGIILK